MLEEAEKVAKLLDKCSRDICVRECPYRGDKYEDGCYNLLKRDGAVMIRKLAEELKKHD